MPSNPVAEIPNKEPIERPPPAESVKFLPYIILDPITSVEPLLIFQSTLPVTTGRVVVNVCEPDLAKEITALVLEFPPTVKVPAV
ncbi:MAG: hypothetical protein BWY67_02099 [Bacteroidetes bacterium ADurb.Bin397]|nr:MAG: hypothetical protein BWY67_02099 [Bacteroidetes bacterium ADurb.Bin397]